jgi:very-short-patch-repair endonuclease
VVHHRIDPKQRAFARKLRREQTSLEAGLWRELRDRGLDGRKFRRQVPIEGYVVDFVCFEARLIVEVDGPLHREAEQKLKDMNRDAVLARHGFQTLRFDGEIPVALMVEGISRALAQSPHPTPD